MTVTVLTLLKRRDGMSKADFIAYYEANHRLIGEKVLGGWATRYERRHLHPMDGASVDHDYDVALEIDFPDQQTCDACFAAMADPEIMREIVEDEERLFDRSRMRSYLIESRVSALPALR
ncbi:EthD domain-containing protein [Novosphingobium sp. KCTC 2891]|uniref:EthD domain-containing protein n=1 Tax=Novosphingobium sp. KCTC 2891 TaxID=2989730 RepID=UPI0022227261|nr:EthD domain-containing protein [Novosphingobium sp. KCTC 2891]MCW1382762.1 EthD domain-containing protein [Novosphingobium sp. KCTC 2891]